MSATAAVVPHQSSPSLFLFHSPSTLLSPDTNQLVPNTPPITKSSLYHKNSPNNARVPDVETSLLMKVLHGMW